MQAQRSRSRSACNVEIELGTGSCCQKFEQAPRARRLQYLRARRGGAAKLYGTVSQELHEESEFELRRSRRWLIRLLPDRCGSHGFARRTGVSVGPAALVAAVSRDARDHDVDLSCTAMLFERMLHPGGSRCRTWT